MQAISILLVATSVVAAVAASTRLQPYSVEAPKRVLLQHVFQQDAAGAVVPGGGRLVVGGSDVNRVETLLDLSGLTRLPKSYRDWQVGLQDTSCHLPNMHSDLLQVDLRHGIYSCRQFEPC